MAGIRWCLKTLAYSYLASLAVLAGLWWIYVDISIVGILETEPASDWVPAPLQ